MVHPKERRYDKRAGPQKRRNFPMTLHLRLPALAALVVFGLVVPAMAQDVPADANQALWCATAFTQVEPQARSAGKTDMADSFLKYGKILGTSSHDLLTKAGFTEDQVKAAQTKYTDTVGKELAQGGTPDFTVEACTALADPAAAAAAAAAPAPATPAPAADGMAAPATPAPAPTTPAPASK
jgi:hypothetical protein